MDRGHAWLELAWDEPQRLALVQITFDTGFHRELTLTASDGHNAHIVRAPQPEAVRDYTVSVRTPSGETVEVAQADGNHQRLCRHDVDPLDAEAVRIHVRATNGSDTARLYEVRCYS
jgi:hypothetical protein